MDNTIYFEEPGPVNTNTLIHVIRNKIKEKNIKDIVVASITGESAVSIAEKLSDIDVNIICVTCPQGIQINIKNLKGGPYLHIPGLLKIKKEFNEKGIDSFRLEIKPENSEKLKKYNAKIVKGTMPLTSLNLPLRSFGGLTLVDMIGKTLELFSPGTSACMDAALMATDNGAVKDGSEIIAVAGTERGLDTAYLIRTTTSTNLLNTETGFRFIELIAKPKMVNYPRGDEYLK